jgi:hypothetical protein
VKLDISIKVTVKKGGLTMTISLPPYDIGRMGVIYGEWVITGEINLKCCSAKRSGRY